MAYDFQLVVDSATPHALADWWVEALGWEPEPVDEAFIQRMVDQGHAAAADTTTHRGTLVWRAGAAILHPDVPASGHRRRVLFNWVPDAKTTKNRLHIDIQVSEDDREAQVARLVTLGATELHRGSQGPYRWVTMADPEGNEFCLT